MESFLKGDDGMKRITFTADADLIKRARILARAEHDSEPAFRVWLTHYTDGAERKGV